jgi:protein arginine kinase activator
MELKPAMMQTKCEVCGLTFDDFRQKGEFGCSDCYVTFREELKPILRRIQGDVIHKGKVPKRAGGTLSIKREIEKLRDNLKELVAKEEYEKAAKVRDEIKKLEAQSGGEEQ